MNKLETLIKKLNKKEERLLKKLKRTKGMCIGCDKEKSIYQKELNFEFVKRIACFNHFYCETCNEEKVKMVRMLKKHGFLRSRI
jgi:hypothetical protein